LATEVVDLTSIMNQRIVSTSRVSSREDWLEAARSTPHATFFHTPYWQDLAVASGRGHQDASIQFEISDGSTVYLPLTMTGKSMKGLMLRCASTFVGGYGGPIGQVVTPELELDIQRHVMGPRYARLSVVGNPLRPSSVWAPELKRSSLVTHVLPLGLDFDALLRGFTKGHRAAYKKGQRLGIKVRRATASDQRAYVALYQKALARWGARATSRYSPEFFQAVFELSQKLPDTVTVWVAAAEDEEVVAGGLFFYWNQHVAYWHGVSTPERYTDSATTVLLGEVIKDAIARKLTCFDFNPSGGHDGVAAFKRHFGALEVDVGRGEYLAAPYRFLERLRRPSHDGPVKGL
jgi:hypothetical protein